MFSDIFHIVLGAIAVVVLYFLYLAATKGLPAAVAWLRAWWTKGKAEVAAIKGDLADAQTQIAALEQKLQAPIATLQAEVAALKAKVGI